VAEPRAELRATYRLQLTEAFGFEHARRLVPYLRDLGVSHLYLSPSLEARPGSRHGYDVIDPTRLSRSLGGEQAFRALAETVTDAGLGIVLDTVPNHMAADEANRFWTDPELRRRFFDVDPVSGRHRRFFDVDDLAGVRQEDPGVFEETHALTLALVHEGLVDGLRIDHVDGLADPRGYLERLRERGVDRLWVEKILAAGERLPDEWPVSGTVGYEFLNEVCGLFVDPDAEAALSARWAQMSGDDRPFGAWALQAKLEHARTTFRPEAERLARASDGLEPEAIELALAALPVYRTYTRARGAGEYISRFQQTTPAIMAKGVEDTAFYRYARLLALNDVGGEPSRFGVDVDTFHARNTERALLHPATLLSTMTHDTKRSGDVRARLAALTWMPDAWLAALDATGPVIARHRSAAGAPDDTELALILQTLVGVWPIELERLDRYWEKALREARRNTSWLEQRVGWEADVKQCVRALLADAEFRAVFDPLVERVAAAGRRISLGMLALKLTCPGIPDIYQGDELELRALVDPDNRRPVDWELHQARLAHLLGGGRPGTDDAKLWLTARLLGLRARRPGPFGGGDAGAYQPLDAGRDSCAFLRGGEVLVVASLRPGAGGAVHCTPGGEWRDILHGQQRSLQGEIAVSELVGADGIAVYERL
jgi:(1->4)-alpha-D-glucan 1-alpha-D-glucosylmutase